MTATVRQDTIGPVLPAGFLVSSVVALASFALSYEYYPRTLVVVASIAAFVAFIFGAILFELLHYRWKREGYPTSVVLAIAALLGVMAFAGWWLAPGSSNYIGVTEYKKRLAKRAQSLALALLLVLASLPFIEWRVPFYAALAAIAAIIWKYCSATGEYLGSDD